MTTFDQTLWADPAFATDYRENAELYIPHRRELFRILRSFYRSFVRDRPKLKICDLGCGDGVLSHQLLQEDPSIEPTLIDGSSDMLAAARQRLADFPKAGFVRRSFQELMDDSGSLPRFNFVVSSFAIHHLALPEKARLFRTLHALLQPGGWFLNIDTVFPHQPLFENWYYQTWQEWVDERDQTLRRNGLFREVAQKARSNPDNKLSPLNVQLELLQAAGFTNVECHYKNGLFVIYAGQRLECPRQLNSAHSVIAAV